ncbi:phosphoribosyltransferase [Halorubraceae archaeon YAN]|nr:phosphoribosyltransferase [Halorubraceae archaeon YAN]
MTFVDRHDAGVKLAAKLQTEGIEPDYVFAIPRGGLPVAKPVADAFSVPLGVVIGTKIGAPHNPELAIGAVAADGSMWLNEPVIAQLDVDAAYIEQERTKEAEAAAAKVEQYPQAEIGSVDGAVAVLVDDGIATGATARACLQQLITANAGTVVLAVPVAPEETVTELKSIADRVVVVDIPRWFGAVGSHYRNFTQVSDEEAISYLRDANE